MANGVGSPCGACKFLRRRCVANCVFAPFFCSNDGPARFAAIHKVFGASNVSKLLLQLPVHQRHDAVVSISFEAQARLVDPIFGCVSHIIALQQEITRLQAQVMLERAKKSQYLVNPTTAGNQWVSTMVGGTTTYLATDPTFFNMTSWQPQISLQCSIDHDNNGVFWQQEMYSRDDAVSFPVHDTSRKRDAQSDINELHALALSMKKSQSKF